MIRARNVILLAAVATLALSGPDESSAVRQPDNLLGVPGFQVASGLKVRAQPRIVWDRTPPAAARAWSVLQQDLGGSWRASWDRATGVPSRIIGSGHLVPGSVASPQVAGSHAHQMLARHIELLAPGASPSDFVLASNDLSGGMRTVGFFQYHQGLRVIGGQVSFRYKSDRLFVIASEALPRVSAEAKPPTVSDEQVRQAAEGWLLADAAASASSRSVAGPFVLPLVGDAGVHAYRTVMRATVDAADPIGRWDVYVDAFSGREVAREQTLRFAQGTVLYNAPQRRPSGARADFPARGASLTVGGSAVESDADGTVTWAGDSSTDVMLGVVGPLVRVINDGGAEVTETLTLAPDGTLTWDQSADEQADAQLASFVHGQIVKDYSRRFAPDLGFLDQQLHATVNIDDSCNAFSDGETINFFRSSSQCANTGQLADVIYHEFGHSLHAQSIIPGAGQFDGAFSEGLSDYLAATIQNDPGMGRGFFHDDEPLRHLDPEGREHIWPDDVAEIHYTGLIFGGAMWDLRKELVATYGETDGVTLSDDLFYAAVQRASNIPTTYVEILAADDDDGDLTNGTPNECMINETFGAHGLRALSVELSPLSVEAPTQDGYELSVRVLGLATDRCPGDGVDSATLSHRPRASTDSPETVEMTETADGFSGVIPPQPENQVTNYQLAITFQDGNTSIFPDNPADPWYEMYVGEVEEIYCTDFEDGDPFEGDWTHDLESGEMREGADDWMWGAPGGVAGSGDPSAAYSGDNVIGNDLGGGEFNGSYQPNKVNFAASPVIDVGAYSDVRLQYRRWLNVEDAFFDQGTIYANNEVAWRNFDSDEGNESSTHHQDGEWRFHDVPLSSYITDGTVQVRFEISSDGGLEMGGWTIDDFCIVAAAGAVCGDGEVTGSEECDDGAANSDSDADTCRSNCRFATCGDGVVDTGETCDDGNTVDGDECAADCGAAGADGEGGGCCSTSGGNLPAGSSVLLLGVVLGLLFRGRRGRRSRS